LPVIVPELVDKLIESKDVVRVKLPALSLKMLTPKSPKLLNVVVVDSLGLYMSIVKKLVALVPGDVGLKAV
jgi:hypothetical protein